MPIKKVKFTIHLLDNGDPKDTWSGYVIMPDDGTDGFLVGDTNNTRALVRRLEKFLETGKHDGKMSQFDERLGWQWMNIADAEKFSHEHGTPVAPSTIRLACASGKISDAKLDGKTWRFPRATFLGWLKNGDHQRGRPKTRK